MDTKTISLLREWAKMYNTESFIKDDPVRFPHRFTEKRDIEISAFLTAWISYGRRAHILQKAEELHRLMGESPYEFIRTGETSFAPLRNRPDVAAVGGRVLSGKTGKIIGGRMTAEGKVFYEGLPQGFGGYLHRAELSQDAQALDLRCIRIQPSCQEVFEKIVGVPYTEIRRHPGEQPVFDVTVLPSGVDIRTLSLRLSEALRQRGRLLYLPEYPEEFKPL